MRRGARIILLAAVLAGAGPAAVRADEEPGELTLERAIELALEQDHQLAASGAALSAAEARLEGAGGAFRPSIDISEIFSWTTNPAMVFSNKLGQEEFTADDFALDRLNQPDALTNWQTRLDIYQPLWAGGRNAANRDAASHAVEAAAASRSRTRQEVIHRTVQAFAGGLVAGAQRDVARQSLESARAHVKLVEDLREAGLVVESDLLRARVRESEMRELVARAEQGVAVATAAVNLAIGRPVTAPVRLAADLEGKGMSPASDEDLKTLLEEAIAARPDLRAARASVEAAERQADAARAARRPELGVRGSLEANDADYPGASGANWTLMATLRFRIYDGGTARARVSGATEQVELARRQEAMLHDAASLQVIESYHDLRASRLRREEAGNAVELAREGLRIVEDRYRNGLTTLVELLDAEAALTGARARQIAARRDLLVARAALDLAVGRL